ncbi:aldo/keto reductase [Chelativorans sp. AA-79]|uniref:aldo/keto reductase family protein n=1 Tax=Chelativorans sp. AA-79 TaxID=3028735 RepID=UPI0023F92B4F|nr:aldo/keto reductase [Chelativorans sp. AA-79]WEX09487.1 aldo/keto reductase [Chelativorans sp. AA-79]
MDLSSTARLHTGNHMPVLGLGTWQLTRNTAETIAAALALGYRMIDTSGDYGTQPGIGDGFRRTGLDRRDIYLVTKVEETGDAYQATKANLQELGFDYADLMLIHRPPSTGAGEELWRALIRARDEGLVRDIGVSNYSIELIEQLVDVTGEIPAVNQIEWSPFGHDMDLKHHADFEGILIQAYSPLTRATRLDDEVLRDMGARYGKSAAQVLIRWNLQRGTVPIPKANSRDHLEENADVFDFTLDENDLAALDDLNEHFSSLGRLCKGAEER